MSSRSIALLIVLIFGVGIAVFLGVRPDAARESVAVNNTAAVSSRPKSNSTPPTGLPNALPPQFAGTKGPSARMRDAFLTSTNFAAFIADALTRPGEGGRFYAAAAYYRCQETRSFKVAAPTGSENSTAKQQQDAIRYIQDMQERCRGVDAQFPDAVSFARAVSDRRGEQDPTLSVYNRFTDSHRVSDEILLADFRRAVAGGDRFDIVTSIEFGKEALVKHALKMVETKPSEGVIDAAVAAATCEISQTCANNIWFAGRCALQGDCKFPDRATELRAQYSGRDLELFDRLRGEFLRLAKTGG